MIQALNDVRARMAEVGAQLPAGTTTITERQTPSVFPIISFVVTGGRDPSALHDYAYYDLRPRISRIPDVSYVTVQGGDIREILIEVDPQALVATNLSIADVADRLAKEHRLKAVGRLDRGTLQYQVLADTLAVDPIDLEDRVIVEKNGQSIRLRDLGRVTIGHEDRTMAIRSNGKDAVALTVFRRLGGNALAVSSALEGVLADAAKSAPPGVAIHPVYDQGLLVKTAIANVRDAIIIGGLMSVAVLLLFLKSLRATLIAALSIPLSLIITFVFLYLTGDTLNLMSLGGLAVAIGLIIDDTVVVIENIARHLAGGESGDGAIDRASREISGAVIGSTLTTILVFVPLAFVSGVVGQFFQSLSLSLSVALLVSMVVSLTIIPVLAARFLGRRPMPTTGPIYNLMADRYEGLLKVGLKFPITAVLVWRSWRLLPLWWLATHMETGFMPDMDEGAFVLDYEMPVGTSLAQTDKVMRRVEAVLAGHARHLRLHPPDRGRARVLRHRVVHGRHSREPQAGRRAPAGRRALRGPPRGAQGRGPRAGDRVRAAGAGSDQRPGRRRQPDRGEGLRPRLRQASRAGRAGRRDRREGGRRGGHERARLPGQSRRRDPARQPADGPGRLDRAGYRVSAQRRALWPGGQHGPGARPDDQDPRPLPRPGAVRPRTPGPVADQPGDRDASRRDGEPGGDRPGWASSRSASSPRSAPSAAPTSSGAKTSSRSSPSPPSWKSATWARSTANCKKSCRS